MNNSRKPNSFVFTLILQGAIAFSLLALIYHIRWFVPYLLHRTTFVVPPFEQPFIWFTVQILSNLIFLLVAFSLLKLFRGYNTSGFFDRKSLLVFDKVILSCLALGILGVTKTLGNNLAELHLNSWSSVTGITNLIFRSFTKLLIFKDPQTMYFLLATILWAVKQFVVKAIAIKNENESFV